MRLTPALLMLGLFGCDPTGRDTIQMYHDTVMGICRDAVTDDERYLPWLKSCEKHLAVLDGYLKR